MAKDEIQWDAITEEAAKILSQYIRIDTTNPPGNEIAGALFLKEILKKEGFDSVILESEKGRGNIIARYKGDGSLAPLLLLHHIDVVPAEEEKWLLPPLSGKVQDGEIWGRGAFDCKSFGVMELMVLLLLQRSGFKSKRDIILLGTADEEAGGRCGVEWMVKNHFNLIRTDFVINEGGVAGFCLENKNLYLCQTAEKGVCWVRLVFKGVPGHASMPDGNNCISDMAGAIKKIGNYRSRLQRSPITKSFIEGLAREMDFIEQRDAAGLFDEASSSKILDMIPEKGLKTLLNTMLRNTFVPTVAHGGKKTNVIPSECYCEIDCRMLPGEDPESIMQELKSALGKYADFEVEILGSSSPTESGLPNALYSTIEACTKKNDPVATIIPFISSGATDSRFFREKGAAAYGFAPLQIEEPLSSHLEKMHGHNERISIKNLGYGIVLLYDIVREFCR
ncbi:MAG: M20/M25/M40 family metallo-hydrolase [Thermodesulfobacteriota bacterium]|nr:M20/M25/M40 family metallo-hydrolase [Thermodesulfobacteriota bacterium]